MNWRYAKLILLSVIFCISLYSCDYGISPDMPVVSGQVQFIGAMPENVQYCFVVLAKDRPPNDELDITYLVEYYEIPDSILHSLEDTVVDFRMEVQSGTYNWLFVAAIGNEDSISIQNVVGEYKADGDTIPTPISLDWNDSIWVHITANLEDVYIP